MNKFVKLTTLLLTVSVVAGCNSWNSRKDPAPVDGGASTSAAGQSGYDAARFGNPSDPLSQKVIYFEYDRSDILPEYRRVVSAHAQYLVSNLNQSVTLEGHGDERGSREYNIALGENRAESIKRMFTASGVPASQIMTISYGEERPATAGVDEAAWAKNRRVEIIY